MRKLPLIAMAAAVSVALAGAAGAAKPQRHVMDVPLPDGSVAHIEYVGDVAPKVTVAPRPFEMGAIAFPDFAGFDQMIAQLQRQSQEMARQAQQMARQSSPGATPYIASFGNQPAGMTSTSVVSVTNGGQTCTRTTEIVSQGPGKPPKVASSATGNCGGEVAAPSKPSPGSLDPT